MALSNYIDLTDYDRNSKKELETELKKGFSSFFHFSLGLIQTLSTNNDNLKIAVVNMQVALELFLKYYFIKNNFFDRVVVESNGIMKYKDFASVLNAFFSTVRWSYMKKSQLEKILESRNAIVHRGKHNEWNEELAEYLITCAFFIQGTLKNSFEETLLYQEGSPHPLASSYLWKKGSEQFAANLVTPFNDKVFCCIHCSSWAMVNKEYFNFDENDIEGFQCLTCFQDLQLGHQIGLINCYDCEEHSFVIDILNEQREQQYDGCCLNCDHKTRVTKCANCEKYYFTDMSNTKLQAAGKYVCSVGCAEILIEMG